MKVELYNRIFTKDVVNAIQNQVGPVQSESGSWWTGWNVMYGFLYKQPGGVASHNLTPEGVLVLTTSVGDLTVKVNDWLIKDDKGEFHVYDPKVFKQNYKLVEESSDGIDEITKECAESHATLKALAVSAEKNKALYNFDKPDSSILETFPTPEGRGIIEIRATIPEFTSLCPITGQPDWAKIIIDYVPDKLCVESKSLKLYKEGFRNFGEFHEACCQRICTDLVDLLDPVQLRVIGEFVPRGGISIHPIAEYVKPKEKEDGGNKGSEENEG